MNNWTSTFTDFIDGLIELDERPKGMSFEDYVRIAQTARSEHPASREAARRMVADYPWPTVDLIDLEDISDAVRSENPYHLHTTAHKAYEATVQRIVEEATAQIENA